MTSGCRNSLLYNNSGHLHGGGVAPSNALHKISESANQQEISGDGPSEDEISADEERIRTIVFNNGLSQRLVDRDDEG